ncbi:MAG TPA: GNAT family N-acetyltransferase [Pseudoflavonifractor sp.]|nr:GNAT family N-acetyltransferase [Pseudoflavonifractor sp.]
MELPVIETERLILMMLGPDAAPMVLDFYQRNRDFLAPWEPLYPPDFHTLACHADKLAQDAAHAREKTGLRFYLFRRGEEDRIIGSFAFSNIVRGPFLSCNLGYKLGRDACGKGYMTEALRAGIDVVFRDYGLHRIEANIMPRNLPSLRLTERLGFRREGLSRQYLKIHGIWEDHVHMVLLNEEV